MTAKKVLTANQASKLSRSHHLTGAEGDDAKSYQERQIAEVIAKSKPKD